MSMIMLAKRLNYIQNGCLYLHTVVDVLINNAGILHRAAFREVTLHQVNEAMQVNLNLALRLSQVSGGLKAKVP